MIYADHAATTSLDLVAFEAMRPFLTSEFANPSQPYSFARAAKSAIKKAREEIANCIAAEPEEIYFTSGGSESDNWALNGAMAHANQGSYLVVSAIEHHAVLNTARYLETQGIPLIILPADKSGTVSPEALSNLNIEKLHLVSVMTANNEVGSLQPVSELAIAAHARGAIFHTDAVQALGHVPVTVADDSADLLSASAHKFNGPRGIGFLYIRKGTKVAPLIHGGMQENGMRAGTENVAGIVGMATALKESLKRMNKTEQHLTNLEKILIQRLNCHKLDFIRNGSKQHIPGSLSLSFQGADGEMLLHRLDLLGICISTGSACDSKNQALSHVIKAIGVPQVYAQGTVRITLGFENTEKDAIQIADALARVLSTKTKK